MSREKQLDPFGDACDLCLGRSNLTHLVMLVTLYREKQLDSFGDACDFYPGSALLDSRSDH